MGSLLERMLKFPEAEESTGLPEILLALCIRKLQIKKDHLLGFDNHSLDRVKHPMAWMLAEFTKQELLEKHPIKSDLVTQQVVF
ncbi:hypothetical protein GCM10009111_07490 [Colwellia asteriadis]|uniref:Uncharacterized protein n=1 Tax=Colwellia asteriadis TaxID=517723 RepID=A0ABN1L409_9GAMM